MTDQPVLNHPAPRPDWLALRSEPIIDADLPIIDPHHHLWDRNGGYLLDELLADVDSGHDVVATVFVQCAFAHRTDGPEAMRPVGETEFVSGVADEAARRHSRARVCAGIVGHANLLLGDGVASVLEAHAAAAGGRFRGIRHITARGEGFTVGAPPPPPAHVMADPRFRAGVAQLQAHGLSLDAWLYHPQIDELVALAQAFPGLAVVLDHVGGPLGIGPYAGRRDAVFADWRASMQRLAACPNATVKLGGLAMVTGGFAFHEHAHPQRPRISRLPGGRGWRRRSTCSARPAACSRAISRWTRRCVVIPCCGTRSSASRRAVRPRKRPRCSTTRRRGFIAWLASARGSRDLTLGGKGPNQGAEGSARRPTAERGLPCRADCRRTDVTGEPPACGAWRWCSPRAPSPPASPPCSTRRARSARRRRPSCSTRCSSCWPSWAPRSWRPSASPGGSATATGRPAYLPDFAYSGQIELVTWGIPLLTITLLGGVSWIGSHQLDPAEPIASKVPPLEVQVVALDWKWLFIYPAQHVASVNELAVPAGTPIHFTLTSASVMNAFFVPQLGSMIYTMNGMASQLWLQADHEGTYAGLSAHFSGDGFSDMHFNVRALDRRGFDAWVTDASVGPRLDAGAYAALARQSTAVPATPFGGVEDALFQKVVSQELPPGPGPQSLPQQRTSPTTPTNSGNREH